jgi:hypothetical protein
VSAPTNGRDGPLLPVTERRIIMQQSYTRCDRRHMLSAWHRVDLLLAPAMQRHGASSGAAHFTGDRETEIQEFTEGNATGASAKAGGPGGITWQLGLEVGTLD